MTNLTSSFQSYPFHLVSPSSWPLLTFTTRRFSSCGTLANKLDPNFVTGFVDAEGSFMINIEQTYNNKEISRYVIRANFQIGLQEI